MVDCQLGWKTRQRLCTARPRDTTLIRISDADRLKKGLGMLIVVR